MSIQDGQDFRDVGKYASLEVCVLHDVEFKTFYRDKTFVVTNEDIEETCKKLEGVLLRFTDECCLESTVIPLCSMLLQVKYMHLGFLVLVNVVISMSFPRPT